MLFSGTTSSIASMYSSNRIPKFGSCQPTSGRLYFVRRNFKSSFISSKFNGWDVTVESMQKLQVYGHPRLPSIGTIFIKGAFLRVGSINFHRSLTPGSDKG